MCLSTVMLEKNGIQEKVAEYVSTVKAEGNMVFLTDVMGSEIKVEGSLKSMDFVKNLIIIEG